MVVDGEPRDVFTSIRKSEKLISCSDRKPQCFSRSSRIAVNTANSVFFFFALSKEKALNLRPINQQDDLDIAFMPQRHLLEQSKSYLIPLAFCSLLL